MKGNVLFGFVMMAAVSGLGLQCGRADSLVIKTPYAERGSTTVSFSQSYGTANSKVFARYGVTTGIGRGGIESSAPLSRLKTDDDDDKINACNAKRDQCYSDCGSDKSCEGRCDWMLALCVSPPP